MTLCQVKRITQKAATYSNNNKISEWRENHLCIVWVTQKNNNVLNTSRTIVKLFNSSRNDA